MAIIKFRNPTSAERQMLFHWLKQSSSYTAWSRLLSREKVFSAAVERAYKEDKLHPRPDGKELLPSSWVRDVFTDESAFESALQRLRRGDRRCFLFLGAPGHFSQGITSLRWWENMDGRERYAGGAEFSPNQSPLWPEIEKAMKSALHLLSDIESVLQTRHTDVPAPVDNLDAYEPDFWPMLARWVPADPALARVPDPPDPAVYMKTGQTITTFGIWEPVNGKGGDLDGPMNYLHGGHAAPTIGFANDGQRGEGRSTWWRLLWADERYGNQPIPDEEREYQVGLP